MTKFSGFEALRAAVSEAGVEVLTYVPGYPITDAAESLDGIQMVTNEKVALEVALGASATGLRSLVLVKHLGANILSDPLSIAPTHTIGTGLVILVAEDVGPRGSQVELDIRHYGSLCEVPVLDPPDPKSLGFALYEAYDLSEEISAPVIVRSTLDLADEVEDDELFNTHFNASPNVAPNASSCSSSNASAFAPRAPSRSKKFDRSIWNLTAKGRHQRYRKDVMPLMSEASETSSLNFLCQGEGDVGIIASGRPARVASELTAPLLVTGYAHPLPWRSIRNFIQNHRKVLIAEEPAPFIESQLRMSDKVYGKLTGDLPWGRLKPEDLKLALDTIDSSGSVRAEDAPQTAQERGSRDICNDCPYWPVYEAVRDLDVPVAGDAGCNIRAVRPPLEAVDVVYGLGSSIGVASGFAKKGIALIGDYALIHSGIQGLMDALYNERDVLVVLLQNRVAAMTGGQKVADPTPLLEAIVKVRRLDTPTTREAAKAVLKEELAREGVSLVVISGTCPRGE